MTAQAVGQNAQAPLRFEVADIQRSKAGSPIKADFLPGGRFDVRNVPLRWIIAAAYKTPASLVVGPGWLGSTNFDIVAKAVPTATRDQLFQMTQTLLAERFRMVMHKDTKVIPVWALVAAKKTTRLTPSQDSAKFECPAAAIEAGPKEPAGVIHRVCKGAAMSDLAGILPLMASSYLEGLPVVDLTGIEGKFDFPLDWMIRAAYDEAVANKGLASNDGFTLSIFDALERLGLRLENRKHPMDSVVVDSIERIPMEN